MMDCQSRMKKREEVDGRLTWAACVFPASTKTSGPFAIKLFAAVLVLDVPYDTLSTSTL